MLPTLDSEPEACFSSFKRKTHRSYRADGDALVANGDGLPKSEEMKEIEKKNLTVGSKVIQFCQ